MAALVHLPFAAAGIHVNSAEIPIMDGSALPFISAFKSAGYKIKPQFINIKKGFKIKHGRSSAAITPVLPDQQPVYTVHLEYSNPHIGPLKYSYRPDSDNFITEVAPARTFALEIEIASMQQKGLASGGTLDNALVIGTDGPLNPGGMRFINEPARHKMLDLIGDLSLLGGLPWADINVTRPGHAINAMIIKKISAYTV
jgi:UDP-3-O-[3-hydroxymyristoyl] N-acetylglucosamine deacetylase